MVAFHANGTPKYFKLNCLDPVSLEIDTPTTKGRMLIDFMQMNSAGQITLLASTPNQYVYSEALSLNSANFSIVRSMSPLLGGLQMRLTSEGNPDVVCMNGDSDGREASWYLQNGVKKSFRNMSENAISIQDGTTAAPANFPCW
jgi:hypothetical protein